jgi:hypothetical protein
VSYNMFPPCRVFLLNDNVLLMQRLVPSIALIDLNSKAHVVVEAPFNWFNNMHKVHDLFLCAQVDVS